jgi:hypothetical protein
MEVDDDNQNQTFDQNQTFVAEESQEEESSFDQYDEDFK